MAEQLSKENNAIFSCFTQTTDDRGVYNHSYFAYEMKGGELQYESINRTLLLYITVDVIAVL